MAKFWGVLVFLLVMIGTDLPWWPWKLIICVIAAIFIGLAKKARAEEVRVMQIRKDEAAKRVLDSLKDDTVEGGNE